MSAPSLCRPLALLVLPCLLFALAGCASTKPVNKPTEAMVKEGDDYFKKGLYEDAVAQWRKAKENYTSPEVAAVIDLKIADAMFAEENYIEANAAYEDFRKLHPDHPQAPYALLRQAQCYYGQIDKVDTDQTPVKNAIVYLERYQNQYPTAENRETVREMLDFCRSRQVQYEIAVGRFYYRTDKYPAAIGRLEGALKNFPKSPEHDETLLLLGKCYILSGQKTKGRDAFNRLFAEYRNSRHVEEARKFMEKNY